MTFHSDETRRSDGERFRVERDANGVAWIYDRDAERLLEPAEVIECLNRWNDILTPTPEEILADELKGERV